MRKNFLQDERDSMKRKFLAVTAVIQAVLFAVLVFAASFLIYSANELKTVEEKYCEALNKNSAVIKLAAARHERFSANVQKLVDNLNDAAPGIRQLGIFVNGMTGKKQRGTPIIECADNISNLCADMSAYYSEDHRAIQSAMEHSAAALEYSGEVLQQKRLFSGGTLCLALTTLCLALVFAINAVVFVCLFTAGKNPELRQ